MIIKGGTAYINAGGLNLASEAEQTVPGLYEEMSICLASGKPVIIDIAGFTPAAAVLHAEDSAIIADITGYSISVTSEDVATVTASAGGRGDDPFALVNYIASSGTQVIDTGYKTKSNTRYELVSNFTNANTYPVLIEDDGLTCCAWSGGAGRVYYQNNYVTFNLSGFFNKKTVFVKKAGLASFTAEDGTALGLLNEYTLGNLDVNTTLFKNRGGSATNFATMKLYRLRIYEGDTKVREYIPFVDSENVACLKETLSGELFYNGGTGSFTYGTDV